MSYLLTSVSQLPDTINLKSIDTLTLDTASLGIQDSRDIQAFINLGPVTGPIKSVIILNAHLLTPEAQNALLKILEEPPAYARLYLITPTPDLLLPTIRSRCFFTPEPSQPTDPAASSLLQGLQAICTATPGERLKTAATFYSKRPELLTALKQALIFLSHHWTLDPAAYTPRQAKLLLSAYRGILHNANLKLCLDSLFLHY